MAPLTHEDLLNIKQFEWNELSLHKMLDYFKEHEKFPNLNLLAHINTSKTAIKAGIKVYNKSSKAGNPPAYTKKISKEKYFLTLKIENGLIQDVYGEKIELIDVMEKMETMEKYFEDNMRLMLAYEEQKKENEKCESRFKKYKEEVDAKLKLQDATLKYQDEKLKSQDKTIQEYINHVQEKIRDPKDTWKKIESVEKRVDKSIATVMKKMENIAGTMDRVVINFNDIKKEYIVDKMHKERAKLEEKVEKVEAQLRFLFKELAINQYKNETKIFENRE